MAFISKFPRQSISIQTEIVLPNDTNTLGNLMGGRLLHWLDIIAAVAAQRHCQRVVVTAAVNNVSFDQPIRLADIVTLKAQVSRAFNSSMEVYVEVTVEDFSTGTSKRCNEAIYTFVAVDQLGNPIQVPPIVPETEDEKKRFDGALQRRQLSLLLAGKIKPTEATELIALLER